MLKRKRLRERGKVKLSQYFQELKEGDRVAIKKNLSEKSNFPSRLQGMTGAIESKRGKSYIVKINDINQEKRFIIHAIHLKKIR